MVGGLGFVQPSGCCVPGEGHVDAAGRVGSGGVVAVGLGVFGQLPQVVVHAVAGVFVAAADNLCRVVEPVPAVPDGFGR